MIDQRIIKARSVLIMDHPFYGALSMRLSIVERGDVQTMATDGASLFYNKVFLDRLPPDELQFCLAHEVGHCALSHMTRRGDRPWPIWQAGTDYVLNLILHDAGFKVPQWIKYFDKKYRGLNVEQVCAILMNEQQEEEQDEDVSPSEEQAVSPHEEEEPDADSDDKQAGSGSESGSQEPGDVSEGGSGAVADNEGTSEGPSAGPSEDGSPGTSQGGSTNYPPSHGDPGGCGEVLDAAPAHDQAALDEAANEWEVYTRQAANVARRQGEGKLPGFIEEILGVLSEPQIDWRETLRRFVDPSATKDYSWTSPSRRMISMGHIVAGMISDGVNHVAMLIDTSGSVDTVMLKKFGAEVQEALDNGAIDKITVVQADEAVKSTAEYTKGDIIDFTVYGRGGTRFTPALTWVSENAPDVAAAIYFTDLDSSDFGLEPSFPVLWAANDPNPAALKGRVDRVPFGEVVVVN